MTRAVPVPALVRAIPVALLLLVRSKEVPLVRVKSIFLPAVVVMELPPV